MKLLKERKENLPKLKKVINSDSKRERRNSIFQNDLLPNQIVRVVTKLDNKFNELNNNKTFDCYRKYSAPESKITINNKSIEEIRNKLKLSQRCFNFKFQCVLI